MSSTASRSSIQVSKQKEAKENQNIMGDKNKDFYTDAHLFVSAIRVCEQQNNTPPTVEDICRILSMSIEHSSYICRKLKQMGIIDVVEGSYGVRLFVRDFLKIEEIPRGDHESKLEEELKKFRESQKGLSQKIESIQTQQAEKKKQLFAEMEKKLKQELNKK
jgi:DNA-binding IscR family transcriptional regulator